MSYRHIISCVIKFASNHPFLTGVSCGILVSYTCGRLFTNSKRSDEVEYLDDRFHHNRGGEVKMVIVVRSDLKMGKGKVAAQCAHSAVNAFRQAEKLCPKLLLAWQKSGEAKVILKIENEAGLLEIKEAAQIKGLITSLIQDAGRTQIAPGSRTVLGVGPGPCFVIDSVTKHLKLY